MYGAGKKNFFKSPTFRDALEDFAFLEQKHGALNGNAEGKHLLEIKTRIEKSRRVERVDEIEEIT